MPRADVVSNPISGRSAGARHVAEFRRSLDAAGWETRCVETAGPGDAADLAAEAARSGADVVVAAGGDGTLNGVASGLLTLPSPPAVGILPRGTSNLVARELRVPIDARGAARVVAAGSVRTIDVARFGGRLMLACGGVGWDAQVVRELAARRTGHITLGTWIAPIRAAVRCYDFPVFRVETDDGRSADGILALFLNCRPYARFFTPVPDARPDDGLVDAVVVGPEARGHLGRIAWRAWRGTLARDRAVTAFRAASFRVSAGARVPWQSDGDVGGDADGGTPLDLTVEPGALRVLAPR